MEGDSMSEQAGGAEGGASSGIGRWQAVLAERVGVREGKPFKADLFVGEHLFVGLNALEPGQEQRVHDHPDQDKIYLVQEGEGVFTVGDDEFQSGPGTVVWAPAGVPHGVRNDGAVRLVLAVVMG
jgi:quercetin dioxygenase-like cupin family protein